MHSEYEDIRSRIAENPSWFDEHGVPRYCEFSTARLANIYWREAALVVIRCQACHHHFNVAFSYTPFISGTTTSLEEKVRKGILHYGDPPNIGCCPPGPSMNSELIKVLQFWKRERLEDSRIHDLEVSFDV